MPIIEIGQSVQSVSSTAIFSSGSILLLHVPESFAVERYLIL